MLQELIALVRLHEMEYAPDAVPTQTPDRVENGMQRCRAQIEPALLARYEQLKKRYAAGALVVVEHGICSGCRVVLPKTILTRLKNGPVFCDHCGRILYDPDRVYNFQSGF